MTEAKPCEWCIKDGKTGDDIVQIQSHWEELRHLDKGYVAWRDPLENKFTHRHNFPEFYANRKSGTKQSNTDGKAHEELTQHILDALDNPDSIEQADALKRQLVNELARVATSSKSASSLEAIERIANLVGEAFKQQQAHQERTLEMHFQPNRVAEVAELSVLLGIDEFTDSWGLRLYEEIPDQLFYEAQDGTRGTVSKAALRKCILSNLTPLVEPGKASQVGAKQT